MVQNYSKLLYGMMQNKTVIPKQFNGNDEINPHGWKSVKANTAQTGCSLARAVILRSNSNKKWHGDMS